MPSGSKRATPTFEVEKHIKATAALNPNEPTEGYGPPEETKGQAQADI